MSILQAVIIHGSSSDIKIRGYLELMGRKLKYNHGGLGIGSITASLGPCIISNFLDSWFPDSV